MLLCGPSYWSRVFSLHEAAVGSAEDEEEAVALVGAIPGVCVLDCALVNCTLAAAGEGGGLGMGVFLRCTCGQGGSGARASA
jgi:hypothetical protein